MISGGLFVIYNTKALEGQGVYKSQALRTGMVIMAMH